MRNRILLADDHELVRQGIAGLLASEADLEIVGQASDGFSCVERARELRPCIALVDVGLRSLNGVDATRRIIAASPDTRVVCMSNSDKSHLVSAAINAGASGYVLKSRPLDELLSCIRAVAAHQIYLCPVAAAIFVTDHRGGAAASTGGQLTSREREIAQLLAEGYSTKQVAYHLGISTKTVATHREHVMDKLRIGSIAQLTRYAIREGLV